MFSKLEKQYKDLDFFSVFNKYYWKWAIRLIAFYIVLFLLFPQYNDFFAKALYLEIFIACAYYIYIDYKKTVFTKYKLSLKHKIKFYVFRKKSIKKDEIIRVFIENGLVDKENIMLALNYYNSKQPIVIESSFFGWFFSTSLALFSIIEIGYDKSKGQIDFNMIYNFFYSIYISAILPILVVIVAKIIIDNFNKNKLLLYSDIAADLSNFYMNFERLNLRFEEKILKKRRIYRFNEKVK